MSTYKSNEWHVIDLSHHQEPEYEEDLELPELKFDPSFSSSMSTFTSTSKPKEANNWPLPASELPQFSTNYTPSRRVPAKKTRFRTCWEKKRFYIFLTLIFIAIISIPIIAPILFAMHFDKGETVAEWNSWPANYTNVDYEHVSTATSTALEVAATPVSRSANRLVNVMPETTMVTVTAMSLRATEVATMSTFTRFSGAPTVTPFLP